MERIGSFHRSNPACTFRVNSKCNPHQLATSIHQQLETLAIGSFDHYMLHKAADMNNGSLVGMLMGAKQKGLIRNIGVSVYTNEELATAIDAEFISSIQVPFNLLDNNNKRSSLFKQAVEKGKELHARSVFLQGLFFMEGGIVPAKLSTLRPYLEQLRNIAREFEVSIGALALQYVLQNKFISRVLLGAVNTIQLLENLEAIRKPVPKEAFAAVERIDVRETELLSPANW
jgi:aryl-alcohol dehydrogenase-like predicted oxidoreductase